MTQTIYQVTPPREITLDELERSFEELNRHLQDIALYQISEGVVGGYTVTKTTIQYNTITLDSVQERIEVGNLIFDGINSLIRTSNFVSGTSGWQISEGTIELTNTAILSRSTLGYAQRSTFIWKDADEIYIDPGAYHLEGTTNRIVFWDSQLTFQFGSGGSNSDSDDLAASDWFYLYIDDSAIETAGSNELTASEFVNDTTEPTWDDDKRGWYNGNDRCIFAIRTDGSANILEFFHTVNFVLFAAQIIDRALADLDDTWTDVALTIPSFSTSAQVHFRSDYIDTAVTGLWRTDDQTDTTGHQITKVEATATTESLTARVITDSAQTIEVKHSAAGQDKMRVATDGWYFPRGI